MVPPSPRRPRVRTWFTDHLLQRSDRPRPPLHPVLHRPLLTAANQHLFRHLLAIGLHIATSRNGELIFPLGLVNHVLHLALTTTHA